ncbi:hypothetical protein C2G38_2244267, partial [Gigaspora rosea]
MGHAKGIYNVGFCYENGMGIEKDENKAFIYYQKSAEMGSADGTYGVGYCYENGIGIKKDVYKEFIYYQKSAEMGQVEGMLNVGNCYREGIGVAKDKHKAFIYYQKSAEIRNAIGIYNIGNCSYQKYTDMRYSDGTNDIELINIELTNPVITINKDDSRPVYAVGPDFQQGYSVPCIACWVTEPLSISIVEKLSALFDHKFEIVDHVLEIRDENMDSAIMQNETLKDNQDNMSESVHSNNNEIPEGNGNENGRGDRNYNGGGNQNDRNINEGNEKRDKNERGGENTNNGNGNGKNEDDGGDGGGNENVSKTNGPFILVRSVAMARREECFQDFEINTKLKANINTNNILEFIINLFHCGVGDMLNKNDWSLQGFVGFYLDSLIIEVSPLPDNKGGRLDLFTLVNEYNPLPPKQENSEASKGYETNAGLQASFFPPGFSANCSVTNSHNRTVARDEWKMRMPSSAKTGAKWVYEFQGADVNRGCPDLRLHSGHWYTKKAMTGFRIIIKQILRCRPKFRFVKLPEIFRQCPQITHTLEVSFNNITNFNEGFNELTELHTEQQDIYVNFNGSDISKAAKSDIQTEDVPNQTEFIRLNRIVS